MDEEGREGEAEGTHGVRLFGGFEGRPIRLELQVGAGDGAAHLEDDVPRLISQELRQGGPEGDVVGDGKVVDRVDDVVRVFLQRVVHAGLRGALRAVVVHAEANAIYNAGFNGVSLNGSTMYVHGLPCCNECAKAIIQSGVKHVVLDYVPREDDSWVKSFTVSSTMFEEAGVEWKRYDREGTS